MTTSTYDQSINLAKGLHIDMKTQYVTKTKKIVKAEVTMNIELTGKNKVPFMKELLVLREKYGE